MAREETTNQEIGDIDPVTVNIANKLWFRLPET